jgi:Domain of Unknown Function with PDB structure (DUF3857)/Transglutaminase-like superfamily
MREIKRLMWAVGPVLLALACGALAAQEKAGAAPVPEEILKAGGSREYPDANALIIFEDNDTVFQEDGSYISREHSAVKILTDKGKQMCASRKVSYHKRYMSVAIPLARVIKKDGRVIDVPKESMKDGTMAETQAMNILEESFRRVNVTFPGLEIGDAIEIVVETDSKPIVKGHYNEIMLFQSQWPILRKESVITGPASRPLHFVAKNGRVDFEREEKGDRVVYRWKVANVPKIDDEPAMPPVQDVGLKVVASTFKDWRELSRYGASLNVGKTEPSDAMRAKVRELTDGLTSEEAKITAIFRFVARQVRYMGSSMDLGAFIEPHAASYTFEKQYGVCRDKSLLMMAMLREIGVDSYDTIINVSQRTEKEIPVIYFEHAICAVVLKDGRVVYMDPTLELSSEFGETYVGGHYVLMLDEKGRDLELVPPVPAERSLGLVSSESRVLPDGSIEGRVRVSGRGFYDFAMRSVSKQVPASQYPMVWQQLGQIVSPSLKVEDVKVTDLTDLEKPLEVTFRFKAQGYMADLGRYRMFKIPLSLGAFDLLSIGIFESLTDKAERKYPMFLFSTRGCRQEETLTLPEGYDVKGIPDPVSVKDGPVSLAIKTSLDGDKVRFTSDFRIESSSLDPAGYKSLRRVATALKRFQKAMVILEKAPSEDKGGLR